MENTTLEKIQESYGKADSEMLTRAYRYAEEAHANQKRASGEPYFIHPCAVADILMDLGLDAQTIAAALLHDVCKALFYKKGFRNVKDEETGQWIKKEVWEVDDQLPLGHGEKSCLLIQRCMKLTVDEVLAIRWHMGGFDSRVKGGDGAISVAYDMFPLALMLHVADIEATYLDEKRE